MKKKRILPHFVLVFERGAGVSTLLRIILTRKIRRAVDRNRIKRIVREFFRQKRRLLPGETVICRVAPTAAEVKNAELFQELSSIL